MRASEEGSSSRAVPQPTESVFPWPRVTSDEEMFTSRELALPGHRYLPGSFHRQKQHLDQRSQLVSESERVILQGNQKGVKSDPRLSLCQSHVEEVYNKN